MNGDDEIVLVMFVNSVFGLERTLIQRREKLKEPASEKVVEVLIERKERLG